MSTTSVTTSELDLASFSRIFSDVTNSYKYLFFLSVLTLMRNKGLPRTETNFSLRDLAIEMAVLAWYPKCYFHLDFGPTDQLEKILKNISYDLIQSTLTDKLHRKLRKEISERSEELDLKKLLLRYVPYALLVPFYRSDLKERPIDNNQYETQLRELVTGATTKTSPLYTISEDGLSITINTVWSTYLSDNFKMIEGWSRHQWAIFLQKRNPNVPGILSKLSPPEVRGSLTKQSKFWNEILRSAPIKCIYSGESLRAKNFDLDHFIPWSFVGHDELWNLIPVTGEANRSKGNQLPNALYFDRFIDIQSHGLHESCRQMSENLWKRSVEGYVSVLKLDYSELKDKNSLRGAYRKLIFPMLETARLTGFGHGWKFSK